MRLNTTNARLPPCTCIQSACTTNTACCCQLTFASVRVLKYHLYPLLACLAGALEVRKAVTALVGKDMPPTLVFDYPSVTEIAHYLSSLFPTVAAQRSTSLPAEKKTSHRQRGDQQPKQEPARAVAAALDTAPAMAALEVELHSIAAKVADGLPGQRAQGMARQQGFFFFFGGGGIQCTTCFLHFGHQLPGFPHLACRFNNV